MANRLILPCLLGLILTPVLRAESTSCTTPVIVIPDGRITQSSFPATTTYWYGIYAQAGHSYSIEFEPPADNYVGTPRPYFAVPTLFGPNDFLQMCRGNSSVLVTQTSGNAPVIRNNSNGAGRRVSFEAQTAGLYLIAVTNTTGAGNYSFSAVDTTLFNPRWGTNGGYDVQWGLVNVSDMPITGTLTLCDTYGNVIRTVQVSLPAGGRVARSTSTSDLNVPRYLAGSALFSHNGPPNAVLGDAFVIYSTSASPLPVKFESLTSR